MDFPISNRVVSRVGHPQVAEIDGANIRVYYLSRSWAALALVFVALLVTGVFLARIASNPNPVSKGREPAEVIQSLLHERRPDFTLALDCIVRHPEIPAGLEDSIAKSHLAAGPRAVATALTGSLRDGFDEPNAQLLILAHQLSPEPGANASVGDLFARRGEYEKALAYYRRELEIAPAAATRAKIVALVAKGADPAPLAHLATDPLYAPLLSPSLRIRLSLSAGEWVTASKLFLQAEVATLRPQPLLMALTAGFAWLIIALHAGQPHRWFSFRVVAPLLATVLGVAGGCVAQFLTIAQKDLLGLSPSGALFSDLGFYAAVIAPRDMLFQLLLMLPFLPVLVTRRSALDTLVVTGCVGLGFAIPGTLDLCEQLAPADSLGRLLTANFFHFAGAALVGLAVCRVLGRERGSLAGALTTIPSVILIQGVYDAFTRIAGAYVLIVLATIAFLILSRVFFIQLRKWRDSFTDQCFLGATLIVSLSALIATVLVAASSEHGFDTASAALVRNLPTLLMVSVVFFGQFKRGFAPIGGDLTSQSQA